MAGDRQELHLAHEGRAVIAAGGRDGLGALVRQLDVVALLAVENRQAPAAHLRAALVAADIGQHDHGAQGVDDVEHMLARDRNARRILALWRADRDLLDDVVGEFDVDILALVAGPVAEAVAEGMRAPGHHLPRRAGIAPPLEQHTRQHADPGARLDGVLVVVHVGGDLEVADPDPVEIDRVVGRHLLVLGGGGRRCGRPEAEQEGQEKHGQKAG